MREEMRGISAKNLRGRVILIEEKKFSRRWITIPLSFFIHVFILTVLIVMSMTSIDHFPQVKISAVKVIVPPDTPKVPPGGRDSKKNIKSQSKIEKSGETTKIFCSCKLVAPLKPPEKIDDQSDLLQWNQFSNDQASAIGVEGGDPEAIAEAQKIWSEQLIKSEESFSQPQIAVRQPRKLREVAPVYPETARAIHLEGDVVIEATTDIYGRVNSIRIISGHLLAGRSGKSGCSPMAF